jgi:type II secretory pathway pseudopilin PulG
MSKKRTNIEAGFSLLELVMLIIAFLSGLLSIVASKALQAGRPILKNH